MLKCDFCFRTVMYQHNLDKNIKQKHTTYTCDICKMSFFQESYIKTHLENKCTLLNSCSKQSAKMNVNREKQNFKCELCKRAFIRKSCLIAHFRWKHDSEQLYKCEICNLSYDQKSRLLTHLLTECKLSKKSFLRENHDPFHSRRKKVFKCEECNLSFFSQSNFKSHTMLIHAGVRP